MRKIPTVLKRDPENMRHVLPEVTPGCEWVLAGEGIATRKYDGTCCMFDGESWWARREVKPGKSRPEDFRALMTDESTGKSVGWVPMASSSFAKWHADALRTLVPENIEAGTYELCGPKINGDPDDFGQHCLVCHADAMTLRSMFDLDSPFALESFVRWAGDEGYEGIVWHHPDGRMAKLKARDVAE